MSTFTLLWQLLRYFCTLIVDLFFLSFKIANRLLEKTLKFEAKHKNNSNSNNHKKSEITYYYIITSLAQKNNIISPIAKQNIIILPHSQFVFSKKKRKEKENGPHVSSLWKNVNSWTLNAWQIRTWEEEKQNTTQNLAYTSLLSSSSPKRK